MYDIFFEQRFLKRFSIRENAGLGISYFYGTNISIFIPTVNAGISLGYSFLNTKN